MDAFIVLTFDDNPLPEHVALPGFVVGFIPLLGHYSKIEFDASIK